MTIVPFKKKNTKGKEKGRVAYWGKLYAHRARIALFILIVLAAIVTVFLIIRHQMKNRVYDSYEVVSTVERSGAISSQVLAFGSSFISYNDDGIRCTDANGKDVWNHPYEMQSPMVKVNGSYVAVADKNGRNIYIFSSSGLVGTVETTDPIDSITLSQSGEVLAVVDGGNVTPIYLYASNGTMLVSFRTTMSKSGYPMSLAISDDGKLVEIAYLYMDSATLMSKVAFYNFGEVGQNKADNLVGGNDYQGEVVPVVGFLDNATAFAVGTGRIMFYEGKETPRNTSDSMIYDKIHSVFYGSEHVGLVFVENNADGRYRMDVYAKNGKISGQLQFDLEYANVFFSNGRIVIYNASSCLIYTTEGKLVYEGDFDDAVILMMPTANAAKYILVTGDSIDTIQLR